MPSSFSIPFDRIQRPQPTLKERLLWLIWRISPKGPAMDALLSRRLSELRHLRELNPANCIPQFNTTAVTVRQCPLGPWSTPLIDVVVLTKAAIGFKSRRILEIGSYIGNTARLLAENTGPDVKITTLDEHPEHGAAYLGTSLAQRIDRRVGKISLDIFKPGEDYDLIFVDADHRFDAALNDSRVALSLLSQKGIVIWHDYQQTNHFSGWNQVPEALKTLSTFIPIVSIAGTWLAMHSLYPGWETATVTKDSTSEKPPDPWHDNTLRG